MPPGSNGGRGYDPRRLPDLGALAQKPPVVAPIIVNVQFQLRGAVDQMPQQLKRLAELLQEISRGGEETLDAERKQQLLDSATEKEVQAAEKALGDILAETNQPMAPAVDSEGRGE